MKWNFILPGIAVLAVVGLGIFAYLHGADLSVIHSQGPIGLEERNVIGITILLSSLVVIPVFIILFFFAWKYRAGNPDIDLHHKPDWDHDSLSSEFIWWLGPTIIVIFLAVIAWHTTHELDPFKPIPSSTPPITIQVVALDWKWLFIYPEQGIATVNMVEFPANTPIHFYITSDAPMNSFWIPSLGGQIMAMPGMTTQLNLLANNTGDFSGVSSNISGKGFAGMAFTAKSVSASEFENWVQSVRLQSAPLNTTTYAALAIPSEYNSVATYSSVDPELYTTSVMKYMVPANAPMQMSNMP